jgi:hypothetical protein
VEWVSESPNVEGERDAGGARVKPCWRGWTRCGGDRGAGWVGWLARRRWAFDAEEGKGARGSGQGSSLSTKVSWGVSSAFRYIVCVLHSGVAWRSWTSGHRPRSARSAGTRRMGPLRSRGVRGSLGPCALVKGSGSQTNERGGDGVKKGGKGSECAGSKNGGGA